MKMNEKFQIWNVLHDGEITAIEQNGETLTMFVSIPYLRRRMKPIGDSFVLTLMGLTRLEYHDHSGKAASLAEEIEVAMPEILSTDSESMPVKVNLTMGHLLIEFESIKFAMDTGEPLQFDTIAKVAQEYWTEWKEKAEQATAPENQGGAALID
jgi:hypothetical protein